MKRQQLVAKFKERNLKREKKTNEIMIYEYKDGITKYK